MTEAEAQELVVPGYEAWFSFAHTLDGYRIAKELGIDIGEFAHQLWPDYFESGKWRGSRLQLRLVLFYLAREKRFTDGPDAKDLPRDVQAIQDLLEAIKDS